MARAALGWSLSELATQAGLGRATIARFELGDVVAADTVVGIRSALERGGIEFISAGASVKDGKGVGGVGVRLREQ